MKPFWTPDFALAKPLPAGITWCEYCGGAQPTPHDCAEAAPARAERARRRAKADLATKITDDECPSCLGDAMTGHFKDCDK